MLRALTLTAILLGIVPAMASTCPDTDYTSRKGPQVVVVGRVVEVMIGDGSPTSLPDVLSVIGAGGMPPLGRQAAIQVDRVLKGNVGREVEILAEPRAQDLVSLGSMLREGPIAIAAYRRGDGRLVSDKCLLLGTGEQASSYKRARTAAGAGRGAMPGGKSDLVLSDLADRISQLGDPLSPDNLSADQLIVVDELLVAAGDAERRVAMWESVVREVPSAETRAELAAAYLFADRYADAEREAERAVSGGFPDAATTLTAARLHLGQSGPRPDAEGTKADSIPPNPDTRRQERALPKAPAAEGRPRNRF